MSDLDPYATLGVSATATDAEVRAAYRRAVQREHPDHNRGTPESARRFEAIQEAYALIRVQRTRSATSSGAGGSSAAGPTPPPSRPQSDPDLDARLAALERELADAHARREQARRAAREAEAGAAAARHRPTDEELGYVTTDDSFGKILADAASGLLSEAREQHVTDRLADMLDDLGSKLGGGDRTKRN